MIKHLFYRLLCTLLPLFGLFTVVCGDYNSSTYYTNLSQAFSPLADLRRPGSSRIGSLNLTQCCLLAVNESYQIDGSGHVIQSPNSRNFLQISAAQLAAQQFPCGATYDGDDGGAPKVTIPNSWCQSNCGGWQRSSNKSLTQWIQPFVGFILPAAVFCLNVPRRKSLIISQSYFPNHLPQLYERYVVFLRGGIQLLGKSENDTEVQNEDETNNVPGDGKEKHVEANQDPAKDDKKAIVRVTTIVKEPPIHFFDRFSEFITALINFGIYTVLVILEMVLRGAAAASIALIDTIIWVAIVFSTAGPMILSGLYEAHIDRQIIEELDKTIPDKTNDPSDEKNPKSDLKTFKHKVHLLYAILVGNLRMGKPDPQTLEPHTEKRSAWLDVKALVELINLESLDSPVKNEREMTRIRLKSMLGCQVSFGASIGAPVAFFLGSFLFSIFSNVSILGDNDTSHALAFGEWWMTIPHVAIVSGCLLAGNNPNTLEAIISGVSFWNHPAQKTDPSYIDTNKQVQREVEVENEQQIIATKRKDRWRERISVFLHSGSRFYKSVYQPVWMWERGRSKKKWIKDVQDEYNGKDLNEGNASQDEVSRWQPIRVYTNKQSKKFGDWVIRLRKDDDLGKQMRKNGSISEELPTLDIIDWIFLVLVTTTLIIIPFILAYLTSYYTPTVGLACRTLTFVLYFLFQLWLSALWLYDFNKNSAPKKYMLWWGGEGTIPSFFSFLVIFGVLGSLFTTVIGTFLQLVGAFRNCICSLPINQWRNPDATLVISTNSADAIHYAKLYWQSTGIASIVLLISVCYVGWWYQRHWQGRLARVINAQMAVNVIEDPPKQGDSAAGERKNEVAAKPAIDTDAINAAPKIA